ncbi:hypothetical protein [Alkaliphilus serpentinus]|uniref:Uncharacterized protein n=1 Tax=Alkaliphilus serpentinus TaxID=1482731 RepID=A0A833M9D4_9FIRM|nr:hypothetical protein [Alkaliphilus serpentinus]KAB3529590.1 hypothetical protein F8153_09045 [Alkaliphilus serpentinus]
MVKDLKVSLAGSMVYEVRKFIYNVAGRAKAEIEVLVFDDSFASQAIITDTKEEISSGHTYPTIKDAVQGIIGIIEEKLKNDEWVKDVSRTESKRKRI